MGACQGRRKEREEEVLERGEGDERRSGRRRERRSSRDAVSSCRRFFALCYLSGCALSGITPQWTKLRSICATGLSARGGPGLRGAEGSTCLSSERRTCRSSTQQC